MITRARRPAVLVAALTAALTALVLAACSSPYGSATVAPPPPTTTTIAGASTPTLTKASELRANLTYLMVEHAYLLAAVTAGYATGSTPTTDATGAVQANGTDLTNALSASYGAEYAAKFSSAWSARMRDIVAYAKARAVKDATAATAATTQLTSDVMDLATATHAANQFLPIHTVTNPATGIADEFASVDQLFLTLVDAQATSDAALYTKLVTAAEAMSHTAEVFAAAAAKLHPDIYPGTATGTAANLRATLTTMLVEHVELASLTFASIASGQSAGPQTVALAANTAQLHNAFASVFEDVVASSFTQLWKGQIDSYTAYGHAAASKDKAAADAASAQLATFAQGLASLVSGATAGKAQAAPIITAVQGMINALTAVIDGAAKGVSDEVLRVRTAAALAPPLASRLAEPIAELSPTRFLP